MAERNSGKTPRLGIYVFVKFSQRSEISELFRCCSRPADGRRMFDEDPIPDVAAAITVRHFLDSFATPALRSPVPSGGKKRFERVVTAKSGRLL
jgi:hypothetical protein